MCKNKIHHDDESLMIICFCRNTHIYLLLIIHSIKPNILFMRRCARDGTLRNTNDLRMCVFVLCDDFDDKQSYIGYSWCILSRSEDVFSGVFPIFMLMLQWDEYCGDLILHRRGHSFASPASKLYLTEGSDDFISLFRPCWPPFIISSHNNQFL